MIKTILVAAVLSMLAACSGHSTSMQDVHSYCRSVSTEEYCESQESVCTEYSEVTLRPYKSAQECRQSCENVRMESARQQGLQSCLPLFQSVESKCNEFCNDNYQ